MSEEIDEEERRQGDRRADERREFRRDVGRRDDVDEGRRGRRSPRWRGILLFGVLLVGFLGWRSVVVGPARVARAEAVQARVVVEDILTELHLPLLAAPAFGSPVLGDPANKDLASFLTPSDRAELERVDARLAPALVAAPRVGGVAEVLAPVRFLLGRERDARLAWEALLRNGDPRQVGRARVGLALLAIRAGLRSAEEQDAQFAFDTAAAQLDRVDPSHPDSQAAAFNLGLIEVLRSLTIGADPDLEKLALEESEIALLRAAMDAGIPRRWTESAEALTIDQP
jgi:hypothetical protein